MVMSKILFLKGLPASGKTTYAKELVESNPDEWVRVNKDDLRLMLHDGKWSKGREKTVEAMQLAMAKDALSNGKNVVVDNTHLSPRHENIWRELAASFEARFEVVIFNASVDECIERDSKRAHPVGKDVILKMFYQTCPKPFENKPSLPSAIIFDIDGTLAITGDRGIYDWDKVGCDNVNPAVAMIAREFVHGPRKILIVSGRDGSCEHETKIWLAKCGIEYDGFWMRPAGNTEKDTITKRRIYEEHIKDKYNVIAVFDDRPCVVRFWRSQGLFVFDCGNGIEF